MASTEFKQQVELHLLDIYTDIGCDVPSNHHSILKFVVDDVQSAADPKNWHSGDVVIAFRRWIEEQGNGDEDEDEDE